MSIWSTILWIEPVAEVGYKPGDGVRGGFVDVASAVPWYGGDGMRLSIREPRLRALLSCGPGAPDCVLTAPLDAEVLLDRAQVIELRDALSAFLARTEPETSNAPLPPG